MLVLSRGKGEAIIISDAAGKQLVRLEILWVQGTIVKLAFNASLEIGIDREEVYLAKRQGKVLPE